MKLMVNNILDFDKELAMALLSLIAAVSTLLCFVQYLLSKKDFQKTCSLFMERFGESPAQVLIYKEGGFFFSFMRDSFFIIALLAKENGYYTRNMNAEEVRFVKSLPENEVKWIKSKIILTIISFTSYFSAFLFYYFVIRV